MFCVLIFSNIWKCTDLISICILQMDESNNCHICSSNQKCVQLSSNTSYCIEGMYSVIRLCFQILFYIKIYLATCIHYWAYFHTCSWKSGWLNFFSIYVKMILAWQTAQPITVYHHFYQMDYIELNFQSLVTWRLCV